jgi:hypothetical protein
MQSKLKENIAAQKDINNMRKEIKMEENRLMTTELQPALNQANELVISNETEYNHAADMLKAIKGLDKKVKETFDPLCDTANKAHKKATSTRKEHQQPLKDAEKIIKTKMLEFSGENEVQKVDGVSIASKWVAVIVDVDKIPRKYMLPDVKTLTAIAKASKDLIKIPGVEFKEEKSMSVRA